MNIPKLTDEQKLLCEGKITPEKCATILGSFQNNKAPGNDGIPIEFYKKLWSVILILLLNVFKSLSGLSANPTKTEGMWIGSSGENKTKPLGIKWPNEPIKSLGVFYSCDQKLLREKNFIEKLDSIKKLINIWSSRGLTIYGKVTIIKSLIIPKFVYISSLLPTPNDLIKDLNQLLFKFLWKGVDKVTRLSVTNEYEKGGLKMIDLESMVKSLRLAWLKRMFGTNNGAWKNNLQHLLLWRPFSFSL